MIISGKDISDGLKASLKEQISLFPDKYGRVPRLVVILVGEDPASAVYVRNKERACEAVGIKGETLRLPASVPEEELLEKIAGLNADVTVDGILVQLPLPPHMNESRVISAIDREKDVDGFHPLNVAALWQKRTGGGFCVPCTPKGVIRLLDAAGVKIEGANAVVLGRSAIVGLPVSKLLLDRNATVTVCHSRTAGLEEITRRADIIVSAIGRAGFVTAGMVKEGAAVIDVGINRDSEGKLCGDVDFAGVEPRAGVITPVPGGVGPMTIACLLENTVEAFLRKFD